eukprot:3645458-Prymnesium_polylepis.1
MPLRHGMGWCGLHTAAHEPHARVKDHPKVRAPRRDRKVVDTCSAQRNGAARSRPASRCTCDPPPP